MKIVVDAMGGDNAPYVVLEGACQAGKLYSNIEIILVGESSIIEKELKSMSCILPSNISIHHCSEVVQMNESPVAALRKKKDSSIVVAAELVKQGKADALVTAGNTGAAVAATTLKWRMLKGVERPGIALPLPSISGLTVLIDAGANISCKPIHFMQYAIMGDIYAEYILNMKKIRVGLLNVGEEEAKGGSGMKDANKLLKEKVSNFIGNVEGRDIYNGRCDVIVCDGFVGNIVLKVSEGLADTLKELTKKSLKSNIITKLGALLCRSAFMKIKKDIDYAECGGAPLLGVNGNCIISHGGSNTKAIKNAIKVAKEFIEFDINKLIIDKVREAKR